MLRVYFMDRNVDRLCLDCLILLIYATKKLFCRDFSDKVNGEGTFIPNANEMYGVRYCHMSYRVHLGSANSQTLLYEDYCYVHMNSLSQCPVHWVLIKLHSPSH
jgi:hypothetical protein